MADDTETRLARLEERLAWLLRHVTEQDKAMLEMSEMLERLRQDVRRLRERGDAGPSAGPVEERPPHY